MKRKELFTVGFMALFVSFFVGYGAYSATNKAEHALAAAGVALVFLTLIIQIYQATVSQEQNDFQQIRSAIDQWSKSRSEFKVVFNSNNTKEEYFGYDAIHVFGTRLLDIAHLNYYNLNNNASALEFSVLVQRLDGLHTLLQNSQIEGHASNIFQLEIDHYTRVVCRCLAMMLIKRKDSLKGREDEYQDETYLVFEKFYNKHRQILTFGESK